MSEPHYALVEALQEATETLRRYEAYHRAKGTDESTAKAEVNSALAAKFEAVLADYKAVTAQVQARTCHHGEEGHCYECQQEHDAEETAQYAAYYASVL